MLNSTNNINIAPYFKLSEFACPCCKRVMLHPKLLAKLMELRNTLERPVYITSGYRCPRYNQKVGGVANSYHLIGLAADIAIQAGCRRGYLGLKKAATRPGRARISQGQKNQRPLVGLARITSRRLKLGVTRPHKP